MHKNIFLHIGPHKTGTTSLQSWAQANEQVICKYGIFYPKSGRNTDGNHSSVAWSLSENGQAENGVFRSFLNEIENSSEPNILVSGEEFEYLGSDDIRKLKEELKEYSVKIILTLRPQHEIIRSQYGEWIKQFLTIDDFSYFWRVHHKFPEYNFTAMIMKWSEFFGLGNMIIISFDEARRSKNGIISEFCHILKIPENETVIHDRKNLSDSAEILLLWKYMLSKVQLVSGARIGLEDQSLGDQKFEVITKLREQYGSIIDETKRMYIENEFIQTPFRGYSNTELHVVQEGFSELNQELFKISGRKLWDQKLQDEDCLTYHAVSPLAIQKADDLFLALLRKPA